MAYIPISVVSGPSYNVKIKFITIAPRKTTTNTVGPTKSSYGPGSLARIFFALHKYVYKA